jgi:ADP-ribose pyrophosphatase
MTDLAKDGLAETCLDSTTVFRGKLLHVVSDRVVLIGGKHSVREYIKHPGASMIIAMPEPGVITLVRQFRYPLGRHFIELPAGKIDESEDPLDAAKRELKEETGFTGAQWRHLTTLHPCIGYSDESIELYLARELTQRGATPDDGEHLEVMYVPVAEALEWVRDGRITEAKAVTGLLWADKLLRGDWK